MKERRTARMATITDINAEEVAAIKRQNQFGLKVIAFALMFIALLLAVLCFFTAKGTGELAGVAGIILLCSLIPYRASGKIEVMSI
jgi:hypothetical protein